MKQSNFSVKLFTQTVLVFVLLSVLLTFVFTSAASAQDYRYTVAKDGFVSGFFGGQTAAYDSDLSLIAEGYPDTDRHISNHVAKLGEMTTFGWYEAGTELTFKLFVRDTGDTFYSDKSLNIDGIAHVEDFQFAFPSGRLSSFIPMIFLGFEDLLGGGDMDFNDSMAMFSNVIMVPVPEPSSIAMLLAGLGLLGFTRGSFLS